MIANQRKFSLLPDLNMPIRDALRGVASLADATEDMLEPAAKLLPEPLRSRFQHAMQALEQAGKRLIHAPIDMDQIRAAAEFATGSTADPSGVPAAARVIVYAWEHLNETSVEHRHLISETIVADRLSRLGRDSALTGCQNTAAIVLDLRQSSAIGLMPGLARGITDAEETEVDLALVAIAVWLASKRAENLVEEEKLLDLSMALVRALQTEAASALGNPGAFADFLSDTSSHL
ncbi:MAG: hypothetical protein MRY75_05905 [Marivita sp.]|uniref:hypothetical protein n=1 Tax=Marivita sp. TaxID=2003365 RepID=UPI0025C0A1E6|nr:hypothetical protein [Marivita sp.]MCI5110070.1 hypothetical protein [Marivita sp.]